MKNADCVAVFDWDKSLDLVSWLDWVLQLFASADMRPDMILSGTGSNESKNISVEEIRQATRNDARYSRDIQMFVTRPGYKQLAFGWRMCATVNMTKGRTAIVACEAGLVDLFDIASQMAGLFGPVYGIGFQRPFSKGPDLYAYGMSAGLEYSGPDRIEMNRIGAWMRERMTRNRHKQGMLRDVYPLNLLTQAHVDQQVEGRLLPDWVDQSRERGQILDLGNQQWIWRLPMASVGAVRSSLRSAGLIIAE